MLFTLLDLDAYRWKSRLVLVFGENRAQLAQFEKEAAGLRERDLLVLPVASKDAPELRRRFHLPEGFCVVLIGKDGGQKASWQKIVRPEEVYRSIDEMPMRKREMQDQSKKPFTQKL